MAFSWCQDKLDRICSVLAHWKSELSECVKNRFSWRQNNRDVVSGLSDPWKREFSAYEINRFLIALKETRSNWVWFDSLKKRIFGIGKKSLFHGAKTILTRFLALEPWRSEFSESEWNRFSWRRNKLHAILCVCRPKKVNFLKPNEFAFS